VVEEIRREKNVDVGALAERWQSESHTPCPRCNR
jgi:hypothetical protein